MSDVVGSLHHENSRGGAGNDRDRLQCTLTYNPDAKTWKATKIDMAIDD